MCKAGLMAFPSWLDIFPYPKQHRPMAWMHERHNANLRFPQIARYVHAFPSTTHTPIYLHARCQEVSSQTAAPKVAACWRCQEVTANWAPPGSRRPTPHLSFLWIHHKKRGAEALDTFGGGHPCPPPRRPVSWSLACFGLTEPGVVGLFPSRKKPKELTH